MILIFTRYITILTTVMLLMLNLTRNLHYFQQSFYHLSDFLAVRKTTNIFKIKMAEVLLLLIAVIMIFVDSIWIYIAYNLIVISRYIYLIKNKAKTKREFVYTTRVKITYTMCCVIIILIFILPYVLYTLSILDINYVMYSYILLSMSSFLSLAIILISNILCQPILMIINYRYINDAKKIISQSKNLKIIGVTGSYGKTSTKNIVANILSEKYNVAMTPKSYNTTLGVVKSIRKNILPYTEVFVCEMGASRLNDIKKICKLMPPDISIITSIGPQHLSTFKSIENIQKGKFEIVTYGNIGNTAILNIDNKYIEDGIKIYAGNSQVITYGIDNEHADYKVSNIEMNSTYSKFDIVLIDETISVETKLLGKHNIYNILCAVIISKKLGVTNEQIVKAIKKLRPVEHRLELKKLNDMSILDDSFNSNPEGSKYAIEAMCLFKDNYKVLVTPGMIELKDKEYELNKKLGIYATKCDYVILVGKNTTLPIKEGLDEEKYKEYEVVEDVYEAFKKLDEIKKKHPNLIALIENDLPDIYSK